MPLQVLLVNGWSDDNKGDCAIVEGLIRLIMKEIPAAEVGIVSSFVLSDVERRQHYRFSLELATGIEVFSPLLAASRLQAQPRRNSIRRAWSLVGSFGMLLLAPFMSRGICEWLLSPEKSALMARFRSSDVVISKGGHIFVSDGSLHGLLGLYLYLFPLLLALRLGKRVVLYGQSLGPVPDRYGRALLSAVLRRCDRILTREELSSEFVRSLSEEKPNNLEVCWDTAFAVVRAPLPPAVDQLLPLEYVAITVRQWEFPGMTPAAGKERYSAYLHAIASTIDYLWKAHRLPVVLAPQVVGPSHLENDYRAWDDLMSFVVERDAVIQVRADLSPGQLMELYGRARMILGTRFHSVILGIAAGTPSVAISYYGFKTRGIMRMLGLESQVLEIGSVTQEQIEAAIGSLLAREKQHRHMLSARLPQILSECADTVRSVLYGKWDHPPRKCRSPVHEVPSASVSHT